MRLLCDKYRENFSEVGNITRSVITMTPVPDDNGAQLVCTAENIRIINSTIQDLWTLNVHCEYYTFLHISHHHNSSPNRSYLS